jgi:hypothetical protein
MAGKKGWGTVSVGSYPDVMVRLLEGDDGECKMPIVQTRGDDSLWT